MLAAAGCFMSTMLSALDRGADPYLTIAARLAPRAGGRAGKRPTYPPGLPLLMAVPHAHRRREGRVMRRDPVGIDCGDRHRRAGVTAGRRRRRLASRRCMLAFTPVFVFQSIQPMSDVPVTAAWMRAACVSRSHRRASRQLMPASRARSRC